MTHHPKYGDEQIVNIAKLYSWLGQTSKRGIRKIVQLEKNHISNWWNNRIFIRK